MIFIDDVRLENSPAKDAWESQFKKLDKLKDTTFWLDERFKSFKTLKNIHGRGASRQVPVYPPSFDIEPQYQWENPLTKGTHMVRIVDTENPAKDAKSKSGMPTVSRYNPVMIAFDGTGGNPSDKLGQGIISGGFLICKANNKAFYQWLYVHPKNKSNPKYWVKDEKNDGILIENTTAMAEVGNTFDFFEDNPKQANAQKSKQNSLKIRAILFLDDMGEKEMRDLYAVYGQSRSSEEEIEVISNYLTDEAFNDPKTFLEKTSDPVAQLEGLVTRAKEYNVIKIEKKAWVFTKEGAEAICLIRPAKDPVAELINFLRLKDTSGAIQELLKIGIKEAKDAVPAE